MRTNLWSDLIPHKPKRLQVFSWTLWDLCNQPVPNVSFMLIYRVSIILLWEMSPWLLERGAWHWRADKIYLFLSSLTPHRRKCRGITVGIPLWHVSNGLDESEENSWNKFRLHSNDTVNRASPNIVATCFNRDEFYIWRSKYPAELQFGRLGN